jgi:hypothetical protein
MIRAGVCKTCGAKCMSQTLVECIACKKRRIQASVTKPKSAPR